MKAFVLLSALVISGIATVAQAETVKGTTVRCYLCQKSDVQNAEESAKERAEAKCAAQNKKAKILKNEALPLTSDTKSEAVKIQAIATFECI